MELHLGGGSLAVSDNQVGIHTRTLWKRGQRVLRRHRGLGPPEEGAVSALWRARGPKPTSTKLRPTPIKRCSRLVRRRVPNCGACNSWKYPRTLLRPVGCSKEPRSAHHWLVNVDDHPRGSAVGGRHTRKDQWVR